MAVLIGAAASKLGSADGLLSKTLSLHLPALLPPQHWDIEISPLVQSAALVGLGLLHCGSGHRLMTEFLLAELARRPSSDKCDSREALVTSAAWALGMVLLGMGGKSSRKSGATSHINSAATTTDKPDSETNKTNSGNGGDIVGSDGSSAGDEQLRGLSDLHVLDRLLLHIDGGGRPADSALFPSHTPAADASSKSSRVLEGDVVNTDVTAPGATIALGLIYIRSGDAGILQRIRVPSTVIRLDSIRPDQLLYRALACCLVAWDDVRPTKEWIHSQIPLPILTVLFGAAAEAARATGVGGGEALRRRAADSVDDIFPATEQTIKTGPALAAVERLNAVQQQQQQQQPPPQPHPPHPPYPHHSKSSSRNGSVRLVPPQQQQSSSSVSSGVRQLDARTALALYVNCIAGFSYGIGIVFAGTADQQASETLLQNLNMLQR